MELATFWFILIGVLWTGYLVLEGFDFGVGMLLPVLGRNRDAKGGEDPAGERRRRAVLTTIGPHWDGNEVWLLTAGGATFAAFPHWYATMFSAFYLPLLLLLVALILRNMGLEYRYKRDSVAWRRGWDATIIGGSVAAPLLVGVALTNLVHGLAMREVEVGTSASYTEFTGSLLSVLNPVSLLGGLTVLALCLTHGAHFLALKTRGDLRDDARALATRCGPVSAVLALGLLVWLGLERGSGASWALSALAAAALVGGIAANLAGREGWAFAGTATSIAAAVATYFVMLSPNVINGLGDDPDLSISAAASSPLTLEIMSWAAILFTPVVLAYTAWTYWIFRRRISVEQIPPASDPLAEKGARAATRS